MHEHARAPPSPSSTWPSQHAEIADEVRGGARRGLRRHRVHRRPAGRGLRARVRRVRRRRPLRRRRQRHRRAGARAARGRASGRATRSSCRPTRSSRPPRRSRGSAPCRCSWTVDDEHLLIDPDRGRAARSPTAPRRSCRCTSSASSRRWSGSRRSAATRASRSSRTPRSPRAPGSARPRRGCARHGRGDQLLPRQEPRRRTATPAPSPPTTPTIAAEVRPPAQPRLVDQLRARRHRHQLPARHRAGGRPAGQARPAREVERAAASRAAARYDELLADVPGVRRPLLGADGAARLAPLRRPGRRARPGAGRARPGRGRCGHPLPVPGAPDRRLRRTWASGPGPRPSPRPRPARSCRCRCTRT